MAPVVDVEKVCRLCFREDDGRSKMTSIFERHELEDTIRKCVQIEVSLNGDEPTNICASCMLSLDSWNKFKILCDNTNAFLQQYIQDNIETELDFNGEISNLGPLGFTPSQMSDLSIGLLENDSLWNCMSQHWNDGDTSTELPLPKYTKKVGPPANSSIGAISDDDCVDMTLDLLSKRNTDYQYNEVHWWNSKAISMKKIEKENSKQSKGLSKSMAKYNRYYRKTYFCTFCPESFTRFNDLISHDLVVHNDLPKNHFCKKCGKVFLSEGRLQVHENIHREKLFKCQLCLKKFTQKKTLDNHLNVHIGQFMCQICGFKSPNAHNLKIHESTHSLVKNHCCNVCEKNFATMSSLRRHKRLVHQKNVMFRCDLCDYTTMQPSNLKYHKSSHTAQTYVCHLCGRTFKNQFLYNHHAEVHEMPMFTCAHCKKAFKKKKYLKDHLSNSHGLGCITNRSYKCTICSKTFSRPIYLNKHTKKFH
ncbi:zinc finger protein 235-like [Adelges cooleyi]|uniref:zinc finger protein 235-like n=1 Tax=Adelges cooleyi TaxID=133065 RepID=UPI00217F990A|nr:zinc finger protein 235-like [Adelges cooleyi]